MISFTTLDQLKSYIDLLQNKDQEDLKQRLTTVHTELTMLTIDTLKNLITIVERIQREYNPKSDIEISNEVKAFLLSSEALRAKVLKDSEVHYLVASYRKLSPQLKNVAQCIADGLSHKDIAEKLHIRHATARNYSSRLLEIFGINRASELIRLWPTIKLAAGE